MTVFTPTAVAWLAPAGWLLLGLALGGVHFFSLHLNTRLWLSRPLAAALLQGGRMASTVLGLGAAARWGGLPALALALLGLLLARQRLLRRVRPTSPTPPSP